MGGSCAHPKRTLLQSLPHKQACKPGLTEAADPGLVQVGWRPADAPHPEPDGGAELCRLAPQPQELLAAGGGPWQPFSQEGLWG